MNSPEETIEDKSRRYVADVMELSLLILTRMNIIRVGDNSISTPSDVWAHGLPGQNHSFVKGEVAVERGLREVFDHICIFYSKLRDDQIVCDLVNSVLELGEWVASSTCESSDFTNALSLDPNITVGDRKIDLSDFGLGRDAGRGRHFRMEMLAAGWLALFFAGCRSDTLAAGVLRLATVQSALPHGLCYWCAFGWVLDEERFAMTQRMNIGDNNIYSIRARSVMICDENKPGFSCLSAMMALAQLYSGFQVALTLRQMKSRDAEFALIYAADKELKKHGAKINAWKEAGLKICPTDTSTIAELGPSLLGASVGLGYFGFDKTPGQNEYGCYRIEREALFGRRLKVSNWLKKYQMRQDADSRVGSPSEAPASSKGRKSSTNRNDSTRQASP